MIETLASSRKFADAKTNEYEIESESESNSECLGFGLSGPQLSASDCAAAIARFLTLHYFYTFILFQPAGIKMTASGKKAKTAQFAFVIVHIYSEFLPSI